jgi:hypothetical protein
MKDIVVLSKRLLISYHRIHYPKTMLNLWNLFKLKTHLLLLTNTPYDWASAYEIWSDKVGWFMVSNTTFNNISVISWLSVLLVEETREPGENHRPVASHWTLSWDSVFDDRFCITINISCRYLYIRVGI